MASSNRGLLIGCVAVTLLGGGCVMTGVVGAGALFFFARAESAPPIAFEGFDPQGSPPVGYPPPSAPIPSIAPVPTPVPTTPIGIAPPPEVAPPEPAGVMRLTSVPDGARVSEGGVALGVTPLDVPVAPRGGSRTLSVEADGYLGSDVTIYDTPGTQQVTLQQARVAEPTPPPSRDGTATAGSGSRTGSSGSGSSGSGSSGSGSRTGSTTATGERPVAATIRPGTGSGTTPRTGTSGSTTGTTGTSRPPRTGALSHDDF